MPVTTGVVGDLGMAALRVLAARDMPAERCRAAVLDRRHHPERLSKGELAEADMAGVGLAPRLAMAAEDIRNLQLWTCQECRALGGRLSLGLVLSLPLGRVFGLVLLGPQRRETVERAHDLADRVGGDARVERRRLEFGVTQQDLDHPNIDVLFEQVRREAVAQGVWRHPLGKLGHVSGSLAGARELARRHRVDGVLAGGTASPAAAQCDTSRAGVRATRGKASHSDLYGPCPARRAASCVWSR